MNFTTQNDESCLQADHGDLHNLNNMTDHHLMNVSSEYVFNSANRTANDVSMGINNNTQNVGFTLGRLIGDLLGTTSMEVAPLDYVANWIFERLPTRIQNWYNLPQKNNRDVLSQIKNAIEKNDTDSLLKLIENGENPKKLLILSIHQRNVAMIEFLLSLHIDIHQYGVYHDINTASTPYQAALISTKAIKKIFKEFDAKNKPLLVHGPKPKNLWTVKFEETIKSLNNRANDIKYEKTMNEFGNCFYEPIINGQKIELLETIQKMDWQQIHFDHECLLDYGFNHEFIKIFEDLLEEDEYLSNMDFFWVQLYTTSYSFEMNSFLKGENYYIDSLNNETMTKFWIANACLANDLNKRGYPDQNEILLRGQRQVDRLVRYDHMAYISTTYNTSYIEDLYWVKIDSPTVVFDENTGVDVTSEYPSGQTILYPSQIKNYQLFIVNGSPYHLAKTGNHLDDNECLEKFSIDYNSIFEELIEKIVSQEEKIQTHLTSNQYGQLYFDLIVGDKHYDMYELITGIDWHTFKLNDNTLRQIELSKYMLWDHQLFIHEDKDKVKTTTPLNHLDKVLGLVKRRHTSTECGEYVCSYEKLYSNLTDAEKGLVFQYTSVTHLLVNSFLKGALPKFWGTIPIYQEVWNTPSDITEHFTIEDPVQWWVYIARLMHAINKIPDKKNTDNLCLMQTNGDRLLQIAHPSFISFNPDFQIGHIPKGNVLCVEHLDSIKDITGLSINAKQKNFLSPPVFLNAYKEKKRDDVPYLAADAARKKPNCQKAIVKQANEINDLRPKF